MALQYPTVLITLPPKDRLRIQSIATHLPKDGTLKCFTTSPDGTQEAYLLQFSRLTPLDSLLHRLLPHWRTHPHTVLALYRSDRNGGHMREVAWQPDATSSPPAEMNDYGLEWVPDGKHITFLSPKPI